MKHTLDASSPHLIAMEVSYCTRALCPMDEASEPKLIRVIAAAQYHDWYPLHKVNKSCGGDANVAFSQTKLLHEVLDRAYWHAVDHISVQTWRILGPWASSFLELELWTA